MIERAINCTDPERRELIRLTDRRTGKTVLVNALSMAVDDLMTMQQKPVKSRCSTVKHGRKRITIGRVFDIRMAVKWGGSTWGEQAALYGRSVKELKKAVKRF